MSIFFDSVREPTDGQSAEWAAACLSLDGQGNVYRSTLGLG